MNKWRSLYEGGLHRQVRNKERVGQLSVDDIGYGVYSVSLRLRRQLLILLFIVLAVLRTLVAVVFTLFGR